MTGSGDLQRLARWPRAPTRCSCHRTERHDCTVGQRLGEAGFFSSLRTAGSLSAPKLHSTDNELAVIGASSVAMSSLTVPFYQ